MESKIQTHLRSSIRYCIATARIADEYNKRISAGNNILKREVKMQFIFDSGTQSTLAGFGEMYEEFLKSGKILDFSGKGTNVATSKQSLFDVVPLRKMNFVDTFDGKRHRVADSKNLKYIRT